MNFPSFDDFYRAMHMRDPFPWQSRLATMVNDQGTWPADIGVPTGLGKSTCVEIAVWALAHDGLVEPSQRRFPRRIWYVVNRRILVDSALALAMDLQTRLQHALSRDEAGPIGDVARALRSLAAVPWSTGPLHIARMRGGAERGYRPPDPSMPTVVVSTVPMYGSRLLFRGYGTSMRMRPIDAALAGTDSLLLLDEAHLAQPLQTVIRQREELEAPTELILPYGRHTVTMVNLSATGAQGETFTLDEVDQAHPIVQQRLHADKPTRIRTVTDRQVPAELAQGAVDLVDQLSQRSPSPAVVVFVNTAKRVPHVRRELKKLLDRRDSSAQMLTLTGRLRPFEAARIQAALTGSSEEELATNGAISPFYLKSDRSEIREGLPPLIVVATQTLEVGADLDFDGLVTESCGVRAMTQRFGRLNRLGRRPWAHGIVVHANDVKMWPVYGSEPAEVYTRLERSQELDEFIDLSPGHIADVLGDPLDAPPRSPQLLPNHVGEWTKTSPPYRKNEIPVEPFISGIEEPDRTVTVLWRRFLPHEPDGAVLYPAISGSEGVDIPIGEIREFLSHLSSVLAIAPDGVTLTATTLGDLRPGMTLVLPHDAGGYVSAGTLSGEFAGGWDPTAKDPVEDLSLALTGRLVLTPDSFSWLVERAAANDYALDDQHRDDLEAWIQTEQFNRLGTTWIPAPSRLLSDLEIEQDEAVFREKLLELVTKALPSKVAVANSDSDAIDNDSPTVFALALKPRSTATSSQRPPRVEALDDFTLGAELAEVSRRLDRHGAEVGFFAQRIAEFSGLAPHLVEQIALAGRLHDIGKSDPRFQALLGPPSNELWAKSATKGGSTTVSIWPRGARHEAVSSMIIKDLLSDNDSHDLIQHLVSTHHGFGRPLLPVPAGATPITIKASLPGWNHTVTVRLAERDWDQPSRFRMLSSHFGPWGLALLETVLRQADHAVSGGAMAAFADIELRDWDFSSFPFVPPTPCDNATPSSDEPDHHAPQIAPEEVV